jgi:uncharacterized protein YndB with AHSA1/START domain
MDQRRRVERERVIEASAEELWEALTDEAVLSQWLGDEVELDPVEGGLLRVNDDGEERRGRVERVEEGRSIAFTWRRAGEGASSVALTLEPAVSGTRVRVVERASAGALTASAARLWEMRLGGLARVLELALV